MEKTKEKQLKKKENFDRRMVWLAGFTLFTAVVWVSLQSYHQLVKKDQLEDVEQLLTPINPNLNIEVLEKISGLKEYDLLEVSEYMKVEPTPEPLTGEEGEIEETESLEATESGEINE